MTGDEHDPFANWICVEYNRKIYPIARRGSMTLCLWIAGIAVIGWLLTQLISA